MLRSETFFAKRDNNSAAPATGSVPSIAPAGTRLNASSATSQVPAEAPAATTSEPVAQTETGSKLIVGPNIKLKGVEITDCDTLVVEGFVEATMDSRLMQIAKGGSFKGAAEIDIAEIHGEFDGQLTVRQKLVIHATGKVCGKISYGKLVIEEGGQLSGEVQVGGTTVAQKALSVAKTA